MPGSAVKFRFIDSFRFMASSLDTLSSYLKTNELLNLQRELSNLTSEKFKLLTRKGVFLYNHIDCLDNSILFNEHIMMAVIHEDEVVVDKLNETQLPSIDKFYNKLNHSHVSTDAYAHAQNLWKSFNIKTLGEYSDLYLKTDLDSGHYYTLPGYTWDCALKYTKVELDYLKDVDVLLFMDRGIRGGVSQCSNRYGEANNKFMPTYDCTQPANYLMYFDVNNLYGWAMCQYLPYSGFEWMKNFENFDVTQVSDEAPEGYIYSHLEDKLHHSVSENVPSAYILEVDLEYPEHLLVHDTHKDLPLCPEHLTPPNYKLPKLMTTLYDKKRYIIHYRNLKQALSLGIKLSRIYRILKFKQSDWLQAYIDLNTKLCTQSLNEFEKNLYKLLINAICGKTMENIRKQNNKIKKPLGWEMKNYIASPNFHSSKIFDVDLAVELNKTEICFNKPLYVGLCILDISKTCVYDFHYNFMLKNLDNNNCKLLFTDTDSLIYQVTCNDVIKNNLEKFDTSDYPSDNIRKIPLVNKKVPGLMKDECNNRIVTHFVGLRSKMYRVVPILIDGGPCIKKSKGIKTNVVKKSITFDDYKNCLENRTEICRTQWTIQRTHRMFIQLSKLKSL
ncbi:hypothetical protein NQ315_003625 [Exocentrus adspersus]|uniref:DNA-directed DNA polymerase n=1 Tax=Exocentrus adspersus TaxID=1586481 RepID=A0AAV8VJG6_9CUCU|nr:hypothetical protein NQ315_003625 [Exocentrus adspersus]